MSADALGHFYNCQFAENRKMGDSCVAQLSDEQFTRDVDCSHGSVRVQIVHPMSNVPGLHLLCL
jgi:hypothetical protein